MCINTFFLRTWFSFACQNKSENPLRGSLVWCWLPSIRRTKLRQWWSSPVNTVYNAMDLTSPLWRVDYSFSFWNTLREPIHLDQWRVVDNFNNEYKQRSFSKRTKLRGLFGSRIMSHLLGRTKNTFLASGMQQAEISRSKTTNDRRIIGRVAW